MGVSNAQRSKALELFILSALALFIELLVIRWMSADIRAFTVFRTFPLVTCFVGLGVGFSLGKSDVYRQLPIAILAFAIMMKIADILGFGLWSFPSFGVFQWQNLVGLIQINWAYVLLFLLVIILILAVPFAMCVAIASRMGELFNDLEPLPAYCYNILGSLVGGIIFSLLSTMGLSPWHLLLIVAVSITAMQWQSLRKSAIVGLVSLAVIPLTYIYLPSLPGKPLIPALLQYHSAKLKTLWSPYQRIDLTVLETTPSKENPKREFVGLELSANRAFYQYFFNLRADSPLREQQLWHSIRDDYALAFGMNNPQSALIVGTGVGQNVTSAVNAKVSDIDAVDIDPVILDVGRQYNPDYALPAVHLICDDARHFFSVTKRKYDVVNFSTLDSHTIAGIGSSVRVDAYVYTKESIQQALNLLNPNGVLVISFTRMEPWIETRLAKTFTEAAGYKPLIVDGKMMGTIFILGPGVKDGTITTPAGYEKRDVPYDDRTRVLTDDWPYLYVQPDIVDYPYILVVIEVLLLSMYAGKRFLFSKTERSDWQLFFMGAAFMLLELHAISFLSLLYGSTWVTSAVVINAILLMILGATILTQKLHTVIDKNQLVAYGLLFASIAVSYFIMPQDISGWATGNQLAIYPVVTILTILPMGIAAVIFASALRNTQNVSKALAFNLFGAVVGGLLEYLSNYMGIRNLVLVSAGLYALSLLAYLKLGANAAGDDVAKPSESEA